MYQAFNVNDTVHCAVRHNKVYTCIEEAGAIKFETIL